MGIMDSDTSKAFIAAKAMEEISNRVNYLGQQDVLLLMVGKTDL